MSTSEQKVYKELTQVLLNNLENDSELDEPHRVYTVANFLIHLIKVGTLSKKYKLEVLESIYNQAKLEIENDV